MSDESLSNDDISAAPQDDLMEDLFLEIENIDLFNANKVAGLIKAKLENKQNRQRSMRIGVFFYFGEKLFKTYV